MPVTVVRLTRSRGAAGVLVARLGVPLLDEYLEFLAGRCRPNTVLTVAYDLKVFTVVGKPPRRVRPVDVLGFMTAQRAGGDGRLRSRSRALGCRARTLPQILAPGEVDALTAALRTHRDRAMVAAMVLGGLRRCEVLGLRLDDLRFGERRVFVAEGKGGHQRLIPVSARFFTEVSAYLDARLTGNLSLTRTRVVPEARGHA